MDEARARGTDPEESHIASRRVSKGTQRAVVMRVLYEHPGIGNDEILELVRKRGVMATPSGLRSRRAELAKDGLVERCGTGLSRYGNPCGVFALTDEGRYIMSGGKKGKNEKEG